jgi:Arc/MetJ family transcription regulator
MPRTRVSTTVDDGLLTRARQVTGSTSDAALLDQALDALLAQHRRAEEDSAYAAYDEHPLDEADEWGDLASFRAAAGAS